MIAKGERIRGIFIILLFITLLLVGGFVGYFYYIRHKEPTQGIFVYDQKIRMEGFVSGHLYQSS